MTTLQEIRRILEQTLPCARIMGGWRTQGTYRFVIGFHHAEFEWTLKDQDVGFTDFQSVAFVAMQILEWSIKLQEQKIAPEVSNGVNSLNCGMVTSPQQFQLSGLDFPRTFVCLTEGGILTPNLQFEKAFIPAQSNTSEICEVPDRGPGMYYTKHFWWYMNVANEFVNGDTKGQMFVENLPMAIPGSRQTFPFKGSGLTRRTVTLCAHTKDELILLAGRVLCKEQDGAWNSNPYAVLQMKVGLAERSECWVY